jgi:hypothetical protein
VPGVRSETPDARYVHGHRLTPVMWRGIILVGVVMAAATLFVLDASLPGGLVGGTVTCATHRQWRLPRSCSFRCSLC